MSAHYFNRLSFSFLFAGLGILFSSCSVHQAANLSGREDNCVVMATSTSPNQKVCFENVNGRAVVEGDLDIGSVADLRSGTPIRNAVALARGSFYRWPDKKIPYVLDATLKDQQRVTDAIGYYHANTDFRFIVQTNETNYVRFKGGSGCITSLLGAADGEKTVTLDGPCSYGNALHEIGHVLGLFHEQSREDRDNYIVVNFDNIITAPIDRRPQFNKQITFAQDIGEYDFESIMHYEPYAFGKPNPDGSAMTTIAKKEKLLKHDSSDTDFGQRTHLSDKDKAALAFLYSSDFVETPDNVKVANQTQTTADLSFSDNSDNEQGFTVGIAGPLDSASADRKSVV